MGEYADLQIRDDIRRSHGFDPGDMSDEKTKRFIKPVCKRVKCPHCNVHPKEIGLSNHIRDAHKDI